MQSKYQGNWSPPTEIQTPTLPTLHASASTTCYIGNSIQCLYISFLHLPYGSPITKCSTVSGYLAMSLKLQPTYPPMWEVMLSWTWKSWWEMLNLHTRLYKYNNGMSENESVTKCVLVDPNLESTHPHARIHAQTCIQGFVCYDSLLVSHWGVVLRIVSGTHLYNVLCRLVEDLNQGVAKYHVLYDSLIWTVHQVPTAVFTGSSPTKEETTAKMFHIVQVHII